MNQSKLEKELAAQKYRAEKLQKEALAKKKRAEAIAHLETQGQKLEGVAGFKKEEVSNRADNTLALLLGRKAVTTATDAEKIAENQSKLALIKQQEDSRRERELKIANESLPPNWESIFDNQTKALYYWNRATNITSWGKPEFSLIDQNSDTISQPATLPLNKETESLPTGWEQSVHPASQQTYYKNLTSGEVRFVKPGSAEETALSSSSISLESSNSVGLDVNSKKRTTGSNGALSNKFQRYSVDPLDPTGGSNGRGDFQKDKMADSTASGPLWQQRPYPAPGTIMRARTQDTTSNGIGPVGPNSGSNSYKGPPKSTHTNQPGVYVKPPFKKEQFKKDQAAKAKGCPSASNHYGPA
jgi:hypothetical protein